MKNRPSSASKKVKSLNIDSSTQYPSWFPSLDNLPEDINRDKYLATIQCYYHHRFLKGFKNDFIKSNGYIYITDKVFRSWIGEDYEKYISYLHENNLFQIHLMKNKVQAGFINKVNTYNISNEDYLPWLTVQYSDPKPLWKIYKVLNKPSSLHISSTRLQLIEWVKETCKSLDTERILRDAEKMNKKTFRSCYGKITKEHLREYLKLIADGEIYYNFKDEFGYRLHSPFTNTKSFIINNYLTIDGVKVNQLDIVNSQMMFFAFLLLYPDLSLKLISGTLPEKRKFKSAIKYLKGFQQKNDMKWFIDLALSGQLYETVANARKITRKRAKNILFKILFSNANQCLRTKKEMGKYLLKPIITIANRLNKEKLIPMMMQRLEVKAVISNISRKLVELNIKHITVHDSIICKESDTELVRSIIREIFKELFNFELKNENIKIK